MQNGLMAHAAQTSVPMHYFDLFSDDDITEYWEEGKDSRKGCLPVDDQKGDMVDFESVGQIANPGTSFVGVRYDDNFMAAVNQLG